MWIHCKIFWKAYKISSENVNSIVNYIHQITEILTKLKAVLPDNCNQIQFLSEQVEKHEWLFSWSYCFFFQANYTTCVHIRINSCAVLELEI